MRHSSVAKSVLGQLSYLVIFGAVDARIDALETCELRRRHHTSSHTRSSVRLSHSSILHLLLTECIQYTHLLNLQLAHLVLEPLHT
uniref:Putative secreted protein n=1 Tax=Amblyomma cajennense TaxID=34607 RepID=A0A023FBE5_AMBCJ